MRTPGFWRSNHLLSTLLLPASYLYAAGFTLERALTRPQRASVPVVSVGNITAGGAGKTPTAIALLPWLQAMGDTVHFVTRGYGGSIRGPHRVQAEDEAHRVGDEALLLARHAPTWVAASRIAGIAAAQQAGATLVVADDALQHHALRRDLSVLVVDLLTGFGNGRLLPAGPLRQTLASAQRERTLTVAIGTEDPHGLLPRLEAFGPVYRADWDVADDPARLRAQPWLAFAGIAYPQKFYATLRHHGAELAATRDFPDHYPYRADELAALAREAQAQNARLITTEKDAVRLPAAWRAEVAVLPVTLRFAAPEALCASLRSWRDGLDFPPAPGA